MEYSLFESFKTLDDVYVYEVLLKELNSLKMRFK